MLEKPVREEGGWAGASLARSWDVPDAERHALARHIEGWLDLVARGAARTSLAHALVERTREELSRAGLEDVHWEVLVKAPELALIDDASPASVYNRVLPPVGLDRILLVNPHARPFVRTKTKKEVSGLFTTNGMWGVMLRIASADGVIRAESWVAPPESADSEAVRAVTQRYEQGYVDAWRTFLGDVEVAPPKTLSGALALYAVLGDYEHSPIERVLSIADDHTQDLTVDLSAVTSHILAKLHHRGAALGAEHQAAMDRASSTIRAAFAGVHQFVTRRRSVGSSGLGLQGDLDRYRAVVKSLHEKLALASKTRGPNVALPELTEDFEAAREQVKSLLAPYDSSTQQILGPLLLTPLTP